MARQPPDQADDPRQDESPPNDRADAAPANDLGKPRPAAKQDPAQPDPAAQTQVEIDRIEAYLRGPTAFSA